jgi:unsaturated chondroitin disaccharide hydrolase
MLEIAKYVSEEESVKYTEGAIRILKAIDEKCCNYAEDEDALVLMGSERYPSQETYHKGVHIPIIYGDFFFTEALFKLKGHDFFIW